MNALKLGNNIKLAKELYQNNPLNHWRNNLDDSVMLLATIPMVRNLFEYAGKKEQCKKITRFLHIKGNTKELTIQDLKGIYGQCFDESVTNKITDLENNFYELLTQKCSEINRDDEKLENKIILSMAIRLKAEEFMIEKINDNQFINNIKRNQTFTLFEKYKNKFGDENENMKILSRVNLMTPENIHLNSFMYEPILDMSSDELKRLYNDIRNTNHT